MQKASKTSKYIQSLQECRNKIDEIDENILKLLSQRMKIVQNVKSIKEENGDKFFVKSAREADMIRDLIKKADKNLSKTTILSIWRKIITSSNMQEQPLSISVHNPEKLADYKYILQQYYCETVPITNRDSASDTILDLEKGKSQIAAFRLPDSNYQQDNNWWVNLANNNSALKIFAKIPVFTQENQINLVILAKKPLERSKNDKTLISIETSSETSSGKLLTALKEHKFNAKILKSTKIANISDVTFNLVELQGFFDEEDEDVKALKKHKIKPFIKILGVYPDIS